MPNKNNKKNSKTLNYIVLLITGLYILNLTAGIDIAPDNIPIIGNIDEAIATLIFIKNYQAIK